MGAGPAKRRKNKAEIPQKPPRKKRKPRNSSRAQYVTLATDFILTNSKVGACITAGLSPQSASYFFSLPKVQDLIRDLRPEVEKRAKDKAVKETVERYEITSEFLDAHAAHIIANGPTHFMRGDSDRVKAIEISYKRLGLIEAPKIVNNNQANAIAQAQNKTALDVYRSKWFIEKEQSMRAQLEAENVRPTPQTTT